MRKIKQENHSTGQLIFDVPDGDFGGFFVRMAGTNQAAQTLGITELGTLKISHYNEKIVDVAPEFLIKRTNLYGGVAESSSAAGGAYVYSFIVPVRTKHDNLNVLQVRNKKTQMILQGFNTAKVLSGTIKVYGIDSIGAARYIPIITSFEESFSAAGEKKNSIASENVEELFVISDANLDTIDVVRDGVSVVSGDFTDVDALSDALNRVETGVDLVEVVAPRSDLLSGVKQTTYGIKTTGAIANLKMMYFAYLTIGQPA